jgi:hypothetical protein
MKLINPKEKTKKKLVYYEQHYPTHQQTIDMDGESLFNSPRDGVYLTFKNGQFVPGVWAGTEGMVITFKGMSFRIARVHFNEQMLRVTQISGAV